MCCAWCSFLFECNANQKISKLIVTRPYHLAERFACVRRIMDNISIRINMKIKDKRLSNGYGRKEGVTQWVLPVVIERCFPGRSFNTHNSYALSFAFFPHTFYNSSDRLIVSDQTIRNLWRWANPSQHCSSSFAGSHHSNMLLLDKPHLRLIYHIEIMDILRKREAVPVVSLIFYRLLRFLRVYGAPTMKCSLLDGHCHTTPEASKNHLSPHQSEFIFFFFTNVTNSQCPW